MVVEGTEEQPVGSVGPEGISRGALVELVEAGSETQRGPEDSRQGNSLYKVVDTRLPWLLELSALP